MMALAVLTQPYPARVKEQFWFRELRQAVAVLAEGKSFADLKRMSEEENFFNASSASRANEIRQVLERRLKAAGPSFCAFFQQSPLATQKLLALCLLLLTDHTFYRFMDDCFREKLFTGDLELYDRDFLRVFRAIQNEEPRAAKWTDATLKKVRANYKAYLREAGLLAGEKSPYQIQRPLLSRELQDYLQQAGLAAIEKILTGERS